MAKGYIDSICKDVAGLTSKAQTERHNKFTSKYAMELREIELQKELCRKLSREGKKEEAKKLFHVIKDNERELYSHY